MMMNLFILGCGRSGTSLVAGLFKDSGFFMGDSFYKNRESNPLGFFEDRTINSINEEIIKPYLPNRYTFSNTNYGSDVPIEGQRWLARIPVNFQIKANEKQTEIIRKAVSNQPFCFKDPRFCYTLEPWRKEAPNSKYICVFRKPSDVVESILKEVRETPYLFDFSISVEKAFETWKLLYEHVIFNHANKGEWLFLYYDYLFNNETLNKIETFSEVSIDRNFPQIELNRTKSKLNVDKNIQELFDNLMSMRT